MSLLEEVHLKYKRITELLIEKKLTVTTMESCTSGLIASLITDTPGASAILKGACVTYSNEAKIMEGVSPETIDRYGVYSAETAKAMAKAVREKYNADIAISVTGSINTVDPANPDSKPGQADIAVDFRDKSYSMGLTIPLLDRFDSKLYIAGKLADELLEQLQMA